MQLTFSLIILKFHFLLLISCYNSGHKILYFAYGSNLLEKRMHINNPSAVFYSTAKLKDYRLDFNLYIPSWRGAVATIAKDPGSTVWGALWTIDGNQIKFLDAQEGVKLGWYYVTNVTVITPKGKQLVARTYPETIIPEKLKPGEVLPMDRRPSITYLQVIIQGAFQSGLPAHYIGYLFTVPTNGRFATKTLRKQLGYPFNLITAAD